MSDEWDADKLLDQLQEDIAGRMQADAFFSDIPVLVMQKGMIESDIENALLTFNEKSGKRGTVAVVMPLAVETPDDDAHAVRMVLLPIVTIYETPQFNRDTESGGTGKKLYQVVLRVLRLFHKWNPGTAGTFSMAKRAAVAFDAPAGSNGINCFFRSRADLDKAAKVQPVKITGDASAVTLTCNTAGASIYYTLDGTDLETLPAPIAVDAGTLLRAAAYHDDRQASDAAAQKF